MGGGNRPSAAPGEGKRFLELCYSVIYFCFSQVVREVRKVKSDS